MVSFWAFCHWSRCTLRIRHLAITLLVEIAVGISSTQGVELASWGFLAIPHATRDAIDPFWLSIRFAPAHVHLLATWRQGSHGIWCWKGAHMQLKTYCNIRQSPTWVIFIDCLCGYLGDLLSDRLSDCHFDILVACHKFVISQEVFFWPSRK